LTSISLTPSRCTVRVVDERHLGRAVGEHQLAIRVRGRSMHADDRAVDVTGIIQWIVDHDSSARIFRVACSTGTTADGKPFSTTPTDHYLVVAYTVCTAH
jgi:hypothetical protein